MPYRTADVGDFARSSDAAMTASIGGEPTRRTLRIGETLSPTSELNSARTAGSRLSPSSSDPLSTGLPPSERACPDFVTRTTKSCVLSLLTILPRTPLQMATLGQARG